MLTYNLTISVFDAWLGYY